MEWISVDEQLPKSQQKVLCYTTYIHIKVFEKRSNGFIFYDGDTDYYCPVGEIRNVTHWMPLPPTPKD